MKSEFCKEIIFHFNKGHLQDSSIPMWVLKTKGHTFYIDHLDSNGVKWSTKETPDNASTKGSIKFKKVFLTINNNEAVISGA